MMALTLQAGPWPCLRRHWRIHTSPLILQDHNLSAVPLACKPGKARVGTGSPWVTCEDPIEDLRRPARTRKERRGSASGTSLCPSARVVQSVLRRGVSRRLITQFNKGVQAWTCDTPVSKVLWAW